MHTVDTMDKVHTVDKEKKTQDKEMKTCTDTHTRENTCIYIKNKKRWQLKPPKIKCYLMTDELIPQKSFSKCFADPF